MNTELAYRLVQDCWLVLVVVWVFAALNTKREVRSQALVPSLLHRLVLIVAYGLLFAPFLDIGFLGRRFIPATLGLSEIGLVLTIAGIAFAIWARFFLGTNWSATPAVKQNHLLIRNGPYRIVRHPIYSGLLLAMFGTALAVGRWRGLIGLAVLSAAWHFKSRTEERYMEEEFGSEYQRYRRQVKGLIPFLL